MPKERSFQYQRRTYEDAREQRDARGGGFDSYIKSKFKMYKIKDGKNLIRILPPTWNKAKHYGIKVFINYGIGPDNQSYLSLSKMLNKPDPLAEARSEADREGDEDTAKELAPRERVLMWVIDREAEDDGPQIMNLPKTVDSDILAISTEDDNKQLIEIDNPDEGQDVRFYREGKGLNTKYPAAKMRLQQPSPLHEDEKQQSKWLDFITENPIPDCLQYYDYDHISKVFNGHDKSKDEHEDDATPAASRARKAEPDEDPPFEPDEKPKRSRPRVTEPEDEPNDRPSRRSAKAGDDDDEEDSIRARLAERRKAKKDDDDD